MSTRRLFSILSILAVVAMLVSACGAPATQAPAAPAAPAAAKAEATKAPAATAAPAAAKAPAGGVAVAPAGQFPIVKDKITMKVFMCPNTAVSDYVNNEFTKWAGRAEQHQAGTRPPASGRCPEQTEPDAGQR